MKLGAGDERGWLGDDALDRETPLSPAKRQALANDPTPVIRDSAERILNRLEPG